MSGIKTPEQKEAIFSDASILVVDDARVPRRLICQTLRQMNITNIAEAEDGAVALSALQAQEYSLIISDWEMPNLSGIEFINEIRSNEKWANLPFIMITGKTEKEDIDRAMEAEVSDLINKPFKMGELQEKVERILVGQDKGIYRKLRVLAVDDAELVRTMVSRMAEEIGVGEVYTAADGKEALELLQSFKFDVVISDWEMPELSGIELLRTVRITESLKDIPFILGTSRTSQESVIEAVKAGVTGYIAKPFDVNVLREKIDSALAKRSFA